jgi:hypothetical protein
MGSKSSRQEEVRVDANVTLKKVRNRRYLPERTITYECIFLMAASILPPIIVMFETVSFLRIIWIFLTRSRSVEKRLICPNVSTRRPLDGFPQNLILETYTKICRETPNLVKIS